MAEKADKKDQPAKHIIDVSHPETEAPHGNSKSIIITNRPMVEDPMVVKDKPKEDKPLPPLSAPDLPIEKKAKTKPEKPKPEKQAEEPETKKPEPEIPAPDEVEKVPEEPAPASTPADTAAKPAEKTETDKEAEQAKQDAEIAKLIDSQKYYLPINAVEKRKTKRFIALGILVSVLLAVAWVNIALDAGLIRIDGVEPLTHFFST